MIFSASPASQCSFFLFCVIIKIIRPHCSCFFTAVGNNFFLEGCSLNRRPSKNAYERKRTLFIRIVAIVCVVLLFGSVLLSAILY